MQKRLDAEANNFRVFLDFSGGLWRIDIPFVHGKSRVEDFQVFPFQC